jgi:spectinomycin phosphotransferase
VPGTCRDRRLILLPVAPHAPNIKPVRERPADIADAQVASTLRRHWRIDITDVRYASVGYGAYHWTAIDAAGARWFATVARAASPDDVADLRATLECASELANAGLDFIVAPVRAATGEVAVPAESAYVISLFPFIDGLPLRFGDILTAADRLAVAEMLAALHTAPAPTNPVPIRSLNPRSRRQLDISLRERGRPWRGGPYAEAARALVTKRAAGLEAALAAFDELVAEVAAASPLVLTHGEPHPGNVIRRGASFQLLDWDTAGLAPAERDLWWILSDTGAEAARYAELTGRAVSEPAVDLYRRRWDLDDVGLFLAEFRAEHRQDQDTEVGWAGLVAAVERLTSMAGHR